VIQRAGTLDPIDVWLAILAGHVTRCTLSVWRFEQGKWRHIVVDIDGRSTRSRPPHVASAAGGRDRASS
jgi:hypothetical protein